MRRALAWLLVPALMATAGVASLLHTHTYTDHEHQEHDHGPAVHEHDGPQEHADAGTTHLESCGPGSHLRSIAYVCATPPQGHTAEAETAIPASLIPEFQIEPSAGYADVRVHGPPLRSRSAPRAPPSIAHT